MKGNQNANMSREEFNNVQAKQVANTAYNGNELYDKGIVRGKIFVLPEEMRNERVEITLNEGYQFKDENGNVINATKIVLEKKKKEFPKTYEECCKILGLNSEITDSELLFYYPLKCGDYTTIRLPEMEKFEKFIKLYLCRNAYWKLYGEEMGLGKPWEPDWTYNGATKYCIGVSENEIQNFSSSVAQYILAFPTEEMRDAFYENFKELIIECQELL